ncbi:hypothetical protein MMO38_13920 [Acinetobacter sp. NIPH 1852]|uniref:hypothetical protein n=1 Tax=Acinetobacter sp. NIPH 1852 TaxID=2923428 RepID=UPI001B44E155|nr:hypothetical protein [Acinetobacter sp. NIPH 1852]MBP8005836.1 hypothetical protein [Acinetobacter sp.]MCH7309219.1 hypothetical protein [Acinetobacter sp. NIPH 1852]
MRKASRPPVAVQIAFREWLKKNGYMPKRNALTVEFIKPKSARLELNYKGQMNKAMQHQYLSFLNQWLKNGKEFIDGLTNIQWS